MQSDRRKKGTGSITKVNDALHAKKPWRASYLINKKRSYKFFAKESEARAFLRNLNADIRNTQALELQGVTFDGYAEEFLEYKRGSNMKPGSYSTLECNVQRASRYLGYMRLSDIDSTAIQGMIDAMSRDTYIPYRSRNTRPKEYSRSSMEKAVFAVTSMLKFAASRHIIATVPVLSIQYPASYEFSIDEKDTKENWLRDPERRAYEEECTRSYTPGKYTKHAGQTLLVHPSGYRLLLLLHTGMRLGEGLALTWDDYDDHSKTLTINKNMAQVNGSRIIQTPKTSSGERIIVLNRQALSDILNLRRVFEQQSEDIANRKMAEIAEVKANYTGEARRTELKRIEKLYKEYEEGHKYIFSSSRFPYSSSDGHSLRMAHKQICEAIELDYHVSLHGLRHTYVTQYYLNHKNDSDFDLPTFSKSIGHRDTRTTMTIYTHLKMTENKHIKRDFEDLKDF